MSGPTVRELAERVRQLEDRLAALDVIDGISYEAGCADASSPAPLAEVMRNTRDDVLAKSRRQMRRVK